MKWYFAARRKHADLVSQLIKMLTKEGHEIIFDWTQTGKIDLVQENLKQNRNLADLIGYAVTDSDVFVMISDAEGTDMYMEIGMAALNRQREQKPRIYSVGEYNRGSLMQHHPSIEHISSIREVFMKECPEIAERYGNKLATIDEMLKAPAKAL